MASKTNKTPSNRKDAQKKGGGNKPQNNTSTKKPAVKRPARPSSISRSVISKLTTFTTNDFFIIGRYRIRKDLLSRWDVYLDDNRFDGPRVDMYAGTTNYGAILLSGEHGLEFLVAMNDPATEEYRKLLRSYQENKAAMDKPVKPVPAKQANEHPPFQSTTNSNGNGAGGASTPEETPDAQISPT